MLAEQVAIKIDGYEVDERLFPIELDNEENTQIRNSLLKAIDQHSDKKGVTKYSKILEQVNLDSNSESTTIKNELLNDILKEMCDLQQDKKSARKSVSPQKGADQLYKLKPVIKWYTCIKIN